MLDGSTLGKRSEPRRTLQIVDEEGEEGTGIRPPPPAQRDLVLSTSDGIARASASILHELRSGVEHSPTRSAQTQTCERTDAAFVGRVRLSSTATHVQASLTTPSPLPFRGCTCVTTVTV